MNATADLAADLKQFAAETERFIAGALAAAEYRALRVPRGIYEQRDGRFMLRVRLPAGVIDPAQMRALAAAARAHGSGLLHATTRQDIQLHDVPLKGIVPALETLLRSGLSTRGGGGNTVRNVVVCQNAGVCPREAFDTAPWAAAVMEFLLRFPESYRLPRKYKIAFSGCPKDCAGAEVNDVGFIARVQDGRPGFALYAGGGMGTQPRVADLIAPFVPAEESHWSAEAIRRIFDRHGNRRNKHRARLRFLVNERGAAWLRERYAEELSAVRADFPDVLRIAPEASRVTRAAPSNSATATGFSVWRRRNVRAQKQTGTVMAEISTFLGEINDRVFERLADVVESSGDGRLRVTMGQHFVSRGLREAELPELHRRLDELGLADAPAPPIGRIVACKGAATCKLGICLSQGLARAVREEFERSGLDLEGAGVNIHMSGCPNSCGRHPVAAIGLTGAARRVGGALIPYYTVQLGGRLGEGRRRFAEGSTAVPARRVPAFLVEFLKGFRASAQYPDFEAFLEAGGRILPAVPPPGDDANARRDWGADADFTMAGRSPGECGAGVFDLIELDLANAREALKAGDGRGAVGCAARALLVTRGEEARDPVQGLDLFNKLFLDTGHAPAQLRQVVEAVKQGVEPSPEKAAGFVAAVEQLYAGLDASLRLPAAPAPVEAAPVESVRPDVEADFRGVMCPLNYVKTKMVLDRMKPGQVLSVRLDEAGAKNVPTSVERDGHVVVSTGREEDSWRVVIRKGRA